MKDEINEEHAIVEHAFQKNCSDIGPFRRERERSHFLLHQKGTYLHGGSGQNIFCHMSHIHFCASVSTKFVAMISGIKDLYHCNGNQHNFQPNYIHKIK